jgi:RHS repeat-associated protein
MRNRLAAVVVVVALVATGLVTATPARAVAAATVTRVDSWARVTPDAAGRVTIPYCPASDPCAFASAPADVVVTGRAPIGGTPYIPAKLLAFNRTTTGFTLRALDPSGAPITTQIDVWYHAASSLTQNEEVGTVTVPTNSSGYATVNYASPKAGVVPAAVVASGVSPNGGAVLFPVSLVVSARTATGFTVRALGQNGAAIVSSSITLSYYAAWSGFINPGTGWVAANATTTVVTDAAGFATVLFGQALPATPSGIVAGGVAPASGSSIAANLVVDSPSTSGFRVRVLNQNGAAAASQSVTLSYHAVAGTRSVQVDPLTLLPPALVRSNGARLQWRRGGGATFGRYEVHRSATAGFTPAADTLLTVLGDGSADAWQDSTAAAGRTYYYKVVADTRVSNEVRADTPAAQQATLTLRPDGREGKATYMAADRSSPVGCYDSFNYGSATHLRMGTATNGVVHRPLLWFDLRDLPTGATVSAATLTLWSRGSVPALKIRAQRITRAWQEGAADYPGACDGSGASWKEAQGGVGWSAAGGDTDSAPDDPSPTLTAHGPGAAGDTPDTIDLLPLVRKWVSGMPNHGVLLRLDDESIPTTDKYFDWFADDADNPALRPSLTVSFTDNSKSTGPRVALAAPGPGATVRGAPVGLVASAVDDRRVASVQFLVDGAVAGSDATRGIPGSLADKVAQITASGENQAAGEVKENLNDGDAATKWLVFSSTGWVGYWLSAPLAVVRYALTSANDFPERDPRDWQLQGSQDGQAWTTLDSRSGELFSARFQRKEYSFQNTTGYRSYRLNITRNNGGSIVQLADWELSDGDAGAARGYGLGWNSRLVGDGQHTIVARAIDQEGNSSDSALVQITVDNAAAPTVSISAPAAGDTVQGPVAVTASASTGSVVDFLMDGSRFATDVAAPYQASWNTLDPLATAYDGTHTLTARAISPSGQTSTSAPVQVTVANRVGMYKASFDLNAAGTADDAAAIPPVVVGSELAAPLDATAGSPGTTDLSSAPVDSTQSYATAAATSDSSTTSTVSANAFQVDLTVTNNSGVAWNGPDIELWYEWYTPQGVVLFQGPGNEHFPTIQPGGSKLIPVTVQPPALPLGTDMTQLRLRFDVYNAAETGTRRWFSGNGNPPVDNPVILVKKLDGALGLERHWQYDGEDLGAGMSTLANVANGNMLLRWSPMFAPGRGLATMVDLTYNSLEDHSESPAGNNFSLSLSGLSRLGNPIDIHPNTPDDKSNKTDKYVVVTDGDGTTHRFTAGVTGGDGVTRYTEPAGVNLYLRKIPTNPASRRWAATRPDKVTFFYDEQGYPTAVTDRNGNTLTFTLQDTPPGEDPGGPKRRIVAVTDPSGRSFEIDYWSKNEAIKAQVRGKIQEITDHDGSALDFDYYDDGNLLRLTQRGGTTPSGEFLADRSFVFTYTTSSGDGPAISDPALRVNPEPRTSNQSTRVYSVRDPGGHVTTFDYYGPSEGAQLRWKLQSRTNRAGQQTGFGYDLANQTTTVTAPLSRVTRYSYDTDGKLSQLTNPLNQTTQVQWTPDFKVSKVTEPTQKFTTYTYNPNGYLTSQTNQLNQTTALTYADSGVDPGDSGRHLSLLSTVTRPKGVATTGVPDDYQWSFTYDGAGNPDRVTDPTGAVTDYDFNPPGDPNAGTLAALTTPKGVATQAVPDDYRSTFIYDPSGQPTQIRDPMGDLTQLGYDLDGRLRWVQDPNHQGSPSGTGGDVRAYRSYFDYDVFGRLGRQSAPKSTRTERGRLIWSGVDYDPNDNVVRRLDPHYAGFDDPENGPSATASYDQMDRPLVVSNSDRSVDPLGERTGYEYDQAGRVKKITQPKGMPPASTVTDDYTTLLEYDPLDRVIRQTRYGSSTTDKRTLHLCYDLAGDLRSVTTPRAALTSVSCPAAATTPFTSRLDYDDAHQLVAQRDALGHERRTSYDPDGNVASVERDIDTTPDPDRVQKTTFGYDMRDRPIQVRERFTATREVITQIVYDPNGNRARLISPRAYDAAAGSGNYVNYVTEYAYDQADRLVKTTLPFGPADGTERQYVHNAYDAGGNLAWTSLSVTSATAGAVQDTAKTKLDYFDPGWIRTSDDPANPAVHFDYTAQGWQAERTPERKSAPGELDETLQMRWAYDADGQLAERRDQGGQPNTYDFDVNGNLTDAMDAAGVVDPGEKAVTTHADYTGFDQVAKVRHRKQGEANWTFTDYTYDPNGNTTVRRENGVESATGTQLTAPRRHELDYNQADWLTEQRDLGTDNTCAGDQRIVSAIWDSGWERQRDLYRAGSGCTTDPSTWPKKQTTTWDQFDNGKLKTLKTLAIKNGSPELTESHEVGYVDGDGIYFNGNRTTDQYVLKRTQTAPNSATTCLSAASPCLANYVYDARDRLIRHQLREGKVETFALDEEAKLIGDTSIRTGSTTTQTKDGQTTDRWYRAGQLTQARTGGATVNYWYDALGNLDCVTLAPNGSQADCSPSEGGTPSNLLADYAYDYLNRLTSVRQYSGGATRTDKADYTYDALDRTTKEVEAHLDTSKNRTTLFAYQGLTNLVTQEAQTGAVNKTKTYSYDAYGHRISLEDKNNTTGAAPDLYTYGYDVHGSVSQLITDAGTVKASYGYDAYGGHDANPASDTEALTSGDTDNQAPINPYRYSGRRLDSGLATSVGSPAGYDMGARRYGPDTGSFLQADIYYDALADLGLTLDPLTQNRYALAGGNPISYVETDGHRFWADGYGGSSTTQPATSSTDSPSPADWRQAEEASKSSPAPAPSQKAGPRSPERFDPEGYPPLHRGTRLAVRYNDVISRISKKYGIDGRLLATIILHEGGNIDLYGAGSRRLEEAAWDTGRATSLGIAQVRVDTARQLLGSEASGLSDDQLAHKLIWDDEFSMDVAARFLRQRISKFGLDLNSDNSGTRYKGFVAYAASEKSIERLNQYDWQFSALKRDIQRGAVTDVSESTIDMLITRARKYSYWEPRLALVDEVNPGLFYEQPAAGEVFM